MFANTELGPRCPVCSSGMWDFTDPSDFTGDNNREPEPEVTAESECSECDSIFELDLELDDESNFLKYDKTIGNPPQGFGWGTARVPGKEPKYVLHIWGDQVGSQRTQYRDKYNLQDITVIEDNQ